MQNRPLLFANICFVHASLDIVPLLLEATILDGVSRQSRPAAMAIVMATVTRIYLRRQNAKLEKGLAVGRSGPTLAQQAAGFRYLL
jgi:hypothetical protein